MELITDQAVRRLASAVFLQAVRDARSGSEEARGWILNHGPWYLEFLGLEVKAGDLEPLFVKKSQRNERFMLKTHRKPLARTERRRESCAIEHRSPQDGPGQA